MQSGKVKWYNADKGFGFINENIFVHAKELKKSNVRELNPGDEVSFDEQAGERGPVAVNIQITRRNIAPPTSHRPRPD